MSSRITFSARGPFFETLKSRVDAYFQQTGQRHTGNRLLHFKTVFSYALAGFSYAVLVWGAEQLWTALLAGFCLGQGLVLIAFNVMHDGAHGSYSRKRWVNWLMGSSMEVLGGSQSMWQQKHNVLHHTYTNVDGKDDDIALGSLMRLSPSTPWRPWHRLQHWYAVVLYSLLTLFWLLFSDWHKMIRGKIGDTPLPKRAWWEWPYFVVTKLLYVGYTLVLPAMYHPVSDVLLAFVGVHLLFGLTLSVVFQLAHTVEGAAFPLPGGDGKMADEWAVHQLKTTANFACDNRLVTFYMGGLNFQVEHHLFRKTSHVHYPALSRIVAEACREHGMPYQSFRSVWSAMRAHFRFLKQMGRQPAALSAGPVAAATRI